MSEVIVKEIIESIVEAKTIPSTLEKGFNEYCECNIV